MRRQTRKTLLATVLMLGMLVTLFAPTAFAWEPASIGEKVVATGTESVEKDVGAVDYDAPDGYASSALYVSAKDDASATVTATTVNTTGGTGSEDHDGVDVVVNGNGAADVTTGKITVDAGESDGYGLYVEGNGDSSATVHTGDLSVTSSGDDAYGVSINTYSSSSADITVVNVTVNAYDDAYGVDIEAYGTSSAAVTAGSLTVNAEYDTYGVEVDTYGTSSADVTVGDMTLTAGDDAYGVYVSVNDAGSATVTAGKINIDADYWGEGVDVYTEEDSDATVKTDNISIEGVYSSSGVQVYTDDGSTADVTTGDISVVSEQSTAVGLEAEADDESSITVKTGSISVEGNESYGVDLYEGTGTLTITTGDVTADGYGVRLTNNNYTSSSDEDAEEMSVINLAIDGTLDGEQGAVLIVPGANGEDLCLTVWKIDAEEDEAIFHAGDNGLHIGPVVPINPPVGPIQPWSISPLNVGDPANVDPAADPAAEPAAEDDADAQLKELEKNINYIIRIEPAEGATTTLDGVREIQGFETAREGEKVTLKTVLGEGYTLLGAFNNGTALLQDADGCYYLVVPRCGGVSLSLKLEYKAPDPVDPVDPEPEEEVTVYTIGRVSGTDENGVSFELVFLSDGTYRLCSGGNIVERGTCKNVDGVLTLVNPREEEMPVEEDGTLMYLLADSKIKFTFEDELVNRVLSYLA